MALTAEELAALMESEEAQALLAEKYVDKDAFDRVTSKKDQLLGEKKKIQQTMKETEEKFTRYQELLSKAGELGFDPDTTFDDFLVSLGNKSTEPATHEGDGKGGAGEGDAPKTGGSASKDVEGRLAVQASTFNARLENQRKEYEKRIAEQDAQIKNLIAGWDKEKIENTLTSEMDRINVQPKHKKLIKDAYRHRATVDEDDDGVGRSVWMLNESGARISAAEFFDAFAQGEEGKSYIAAPQNTGGGSVGGRGGKNVIDYGQAIGEAQKNKDSVGGVAAKMAAFAQKTGGR